MHSFRSSGPAKHLCQTIFWLGIFSVCILAGCTKAPQVVHEKPSEPEIVHRPPPEPPPSTQERWNRLIRENRSASVTEKLAVVNRFFNDLDEVDDRFLWGREDYWATLPETLAKSGGDCEDFTIAKYFTLRRLNIPEENMRLTYVIYLKTRKPHMVLTFKVSPQDEPLVPDSLNNYLFPVSERTDLVPVYSFNEKDYWLAQKDKGWRGKRLGSASRLSPWKGVLKRMAMMRSS